MLQMWFDKIPPPASLNSHSEYGVVNIITITFSMAEKMVEMQWCYRWTPFSIKIPLNHTRKAHLAQINGDLCVCVYACACMSICLLLWVKIILNFSIDFNIFFDKYLCPFSFQQWRSNGKWLIHVCLLNRYRNNLNLFALIVNMNHSPGIHNHCTQNCVRLLFFF